MKWTRFRLAAKASSPGFPAGPPASFDRARWVQIALFACVVILFLAGCVTLAWTRVPDTDEGNFASCAYEFATRARLATPMWRDFMPGAERHMMYMLPLYFVQLGVWGQAFGFDLRVLRLASVAWGLVLILAWALIARKVIRRGSGVLACIALIACNYDIVNLCSSRYDVMSAALSSLGLAAYLWFREQDLKRAVLASSGCLAVACLSHQYAVFGVVAVVICALFLDRERLTWKLVLLAAIPFVAAAAALGAYLLQEPETAVAQLRLSGAGRLKYLTSPLAAVQSEIADRWLRAFAGFRPNTPVAMRLKIFLLAALLGGFLGCLFTARIRENRLLRPLLAVEVVFFLLLAFFEGQRWYAYLIQVLPLFFMVLGTWLAHLLSRPGLVRWGAAGVWVCTLTYSIATVAYRARINDYANTYLPTADYLRSHVGPGEPVVGPAEFGVSLGFPATYWADQTLRYRKQPLPEWIVVDSPARANWEKLAESKPEQFAHIQAMLQQSQMVFAARGPYRFYEVYHRGPAARPAPPQAGRDQPPPAPRP